MGYTIFSLYMYILFSISDHLLSAATTYDICKFLGEVNAITMNIKIVTLLQPPPETFALFDDLVLLSDGMVIYSGPVEEVVPYFESLGYKLPDRMDAADWLQVSFELSWKVHIFYQSSITYLKTNLVELLIRRHCQLKMEKTSSKPLIAMDSSKHQSI
jgi:ABC-type multidrug transport system ATPase subunit